MAKRARTEDVTSDERDSETGSEAVGTLGPRVCACRKEGKSHLVVNVVFITHGDDGDIFSSCKALVVRVPVVDLFRDRTMAPWRVARSTFKVNVRFNNDKLTTEMPDFLQRFCKYGAFGMRTDDIDRPLRPDARQQLARNLSLIDLDDAVRLCGEHDKAVETGNDYSARVCKAAREMVKALPEEELRRRATRYDAGFGPSQDFSDYFLPAGYECLEDNTTSSYDATVLVEAHYLHA